MISIISLTATKLLSADTNAYVNNDILLKLRGSIITFFISLQGNL